MARKLGAVLAVIAFGGLLFPVVGYGVYRQLGTRLDARVEGQYAPVFFRPVFYIKNLRLEWDNKVKVHSGDVKVEYDPASLLSGALNVRLSGHKVPVTLLQDWAYAAQKPDLVLDDFFADVTFASRGLKDINALRAVSPEIQFQLEKK
ncbi:MAG TPA: hypothetical protein VL688_02185 [Verrucomicrobiae bacterium]|jgi:hypothetical protein|nr:hypothetical protein [Verrucomicrobiae bacterium]